VDSYQIKTVEAPGDTLDETRHRDGHVLSKLPIKYPEFVVKCFISRPLCDTRTFIHSSRHHRNREKEPTYPDPDARIEVGPLQQRRHVCCRVVKKFTRRQVLIRDAEEPVAHDEEDGSEKSSQLAWFYLCRLWYDSSRVEVRFAVEKLAALLGFQLLLCR
jgi:hypothetical protein